MISRLITPFFYLLKYWLIFIKILCFRHKCLNFQCQSTPCPCYVPAPLNGSNRQCHWWKCKWGKLKWRKVQTRPSEPFRGNRGNAKEKGTFYISMGILKGNCPCGSGGLECKWKCKQLLENIFVPDMVLQMIGYLHLHLENIAKCAAQQH